MKNQKRNNPAPKKPEAPEPKGPQPMDPEGPTTTMTEAVKAHVSRERVAYCLDTLVKEVHELFPETPVEYSERNNRGVALAVSFDLTTLDQTDREALTELLLSLPELDERLVGAVGDEDGVAVVAYGSPRTQDIRTVFGIVQAYRIYTQLGSV